MYGFSDWDPNGQRVQLAASVDRHNPRHRRVLLGAVLIVLLFVALGIVGALVA